jgi:hypothetical protein
MELNIGLDISFGIMQERRGEKYGTEHMKSVMQNILLQMMIIPVEFSMDVILVRIKSVFLINLGSDFSITYDLRTIKINIAMGSVT